MSTTLEQLREQYAASYITAEQLLADHLPHIGSVSHLRRKIRAGHLDIKLQQIDPSSNRSPWIIYLTNLADWLDKQAAASAAA
ncbi:MAG: pyocin activator PrtN family protein [Gammaproteobacteria bacterium]|uniref:Putative pyocin activator protein n=1 Tax=viral metagenome TaxID=1070528 RepID=A0A6M3MGM3_9ZZZZ|nr:pyocin activator PrtN family protein [Gammaproteobacteria bacterium]MBU0883277.1 pyocin activator PrtN family protein [Gammaproteobacteria bacterium]MBU1858770.1 pyocin activator PrtN family protein [Gammaproteobacteria bacterium]